MNMLIETLGMVGQNPIVWVGVCALALSALSALHKWRRCPALHDSVNFTAEEIAAAKERGLEAGTRFLMVMLAGIAAILAGLGMIAKSVFPELGFLLVVAGVFVVQTEPARLRLNEAVTRVIASKDSPVEVQELAIDRLRQNHGWNIGLNVVILIGVGAALLAF